MKLGDPIRISKSERSWHIRELLREIDEFQGCCASLVCSFGYGPCGLSLNVRDIVADRNFGCSLGQTPSVLIKTYFALIRRGRYVASTRQQRRDLVDLLIQIEPVTEDEDPLRVWRALRDRSLVRRHLARLSEQRS